MSLLPQNYQRITMSDNNTGHVRTTYLASIKTKIPDTNAEEFQSIIDGLRSMSHSNIKETDLADFEDYSVELLARLDRHLDAQVSAEDKAVNAEQLNRLLNQKIAYIDRDVMNGMLYIASIVALAAIALLAVTGTAAFLMANPVMSFMIVLPLFALIAMAVMIENPDHREYKLQAIGGALFYSGYLLYLAPGLFLATAGAYLAAFATLVGVAFAIEHCVNEINFSANNYKLKSDVSALINTGIFANNPSEQADIEHEMSSVGSLDMA